jgi:hypothetical protein
MISVGQGVTPAYGLRDDPVEYVDRAMKAIPARSCARAKFSIVMVIDVQVLWVRNFEGGEDERLSGKMK